jgi:RNA polymerase sigma-32 factor
MIATKALSIPRLDPDSNLSRYLQEIRKFPVLKRDEEFQLAKRWREDGDSDAAHRLVTSHLRLVAKIAMGYRGYGLPMGELISEGNVGMMQAVKRFDPDRGFRLSTYAMWWIKASIHEFVMRSWSLVKIGTTMAQKKLFFNLRRIKAEIQAFDEGDLDPDDVKTIANRLDVREDEVVKMNRRMLAPDNSLNAPLHVDGEGEWQDWLVDQGDSQETRLADQEELDQRRVLLRDGLERLTRRERRILIDRRLIEDRSTLEKLAQEYGISRERVRQIEVRAFEKLQKSMNAAALEARPRG